MNVSQILPRGVELPAAGTVTLFSTGWCGYCRRLKAGLDREGIGYTEIDIERSPAAAELVEVINHGNRTVPTVVFPDGDCETNPSPGQVRSRLGGN